MVGIEIIHPSSDHRVLVGTLHALALSVVTGTHVDLTTTLGVHWRERALVLTLLLLELDLLLDLVGNVANIIVGVIGILNRPLLTLTSVRLLASLDFSFLFLLVRYKLICILIIYSLARLARCAVSLRLSILAKDSAVSHGLR